MTTPSVCGMSTLVETSSPSRGIRLGSIAYRSVRMAEHSLLGVRTAPSVCGMSTLVETSPPWKQLRSRVYRSVQMVRPSQVGVRTALSVCGMLTLAEHSPSSRGIRVRSIAYRSVRMAEHSLLGGRDGTVRLWDVDTGRTLTTLAGHALGVNSVSFSPDGRTLATGNWGDTVRLWDVDTGRTLITLDTWTVNSVSFSPDGRTLATGGQDGTVPSVGCQHWQNTHHPHGAYVLCQ